MSFIGTRRTAANRSGLGNLSLRGGLPRLDPLDPINRGLVGLWPLGGGTIRGTSAADITGNTNGTLNGSPTLVNGLTGQALSFNGSTSSITTSSMPPGSQAQTTICCWFKLPSSSFSSGALLALSLPSGGRTGIAVSPTAITPNMSETGGASYSWTADTNWHHVALAIDQTQTSQATLYVDGVVTSAAAINSPTSNVWSVFNVAGERYFNGAVNDLLAVSVCDARLYYRLITPAEAYRLYTDRSGNVGLLAPFQFTGKAAASSPTNLTLTQATWSWAAKTLSTDQRQQSTIPATPWTWTATPPTVDQKQQVTVSAVGWVWNAVSLVIAGAVRRWLTLLGCG